MKSIQIRSFFWSVFSRIRTEYGEILGIFLYSVRMWENTDQQKLLIWTLFTECQSLYLCLTNTRKCSEIGLKLTMKTPDRRQISDIILEPLLLTLSTCHFFF